MGFDREVMAGNLRAMRARRRMSQKEVADSVGFDVNTITNYESGKSIPNYENAWKLADFYGVPLCAIGSRDEREYEATR